MLVRLCFLRSIPRLIRVCVARVFRISCCVIGDRGFDIPIVSSEI